MTSVAEIIRDEIRALAAYHVPDSSGMVKLDAMENPYRLPQSLGRELGELCANAHINRYPDPSGSALRARLRRAMAIPDSAEVMLGNGSDELIQIVAMACARPGAVIMGVEPSFVMYRMIAAYTGMRYVGVPLKPDFTLDEAALLEAIAREQPALLFIAYPNNPTGNLFDDDALLRVIDAAPGLVVVDEAYHAFAGRSFLPRVAQYDRLLVMRTLSKLGLAGLRLGFMVGAPRWLAEFDKLRLPYNVNTLTQVVAERVLREGIILDSQALAIREERATLVAELKALPGVQAFCSDANFILFRLVGAAHVFESLKRKGILIKNLDGTHPLLAGCLRVTVGTPEENAAFVAALSDIIKAN